MDNPRVTILTAALAISVGWSPIWAKDAVPGLARSPAVSLDAPTPVALDNGYLILGFDKLSSFDFTPPAYNPDPAVPPAGGEEQIPAAVKKWSGQKAVITGYMMPLKLDGGLATQFLIMRTTASCCFGGILNMNEFVVVTMKDGGVLPLMDVPISFYGELEVGAAFENRYLTGIYALKGEKMGAVQDQ